LAEPAPVIGLMSLGDSSVNFVVRPWVNSQDYWPVLFDLNERMKKQFDAEGISIPFPQRDVHIIDRKTV
jgi:small conductance mechanosensitive channel